MRTGSDDTTIILGRIVPRRPQRTDDDGGRPLVTTAALAGLGTAAIGLVLCFSLALTGWFLADAGAHGDTRDALRVGADLWLLGHGGGMVVAGLPIGVTPLTVTAVLAVLGFRGARWAATHGLPPEDDRALGAAVAVFVCAYVTMVVVTAVVAGQPSADPDLPRAVLGGLLMAALPGTLGLVTATGRLAELLDPLPPWVEEVALGALYAVLSLLLAAAVTVATALLLSFNEAATVISQLDLGAGDALAVTVVVALIAPNVAGFAASYLLGPGFAFGTGTTVSPTAVSLGVVPAFPLLAALPGEGAPPGALVLVLAVPAIAAGLGAALVRRGLAALAWDLAALRGAASGFVAGLGVTALASMSGGSLGTGRMADIGVPTTEVLVFATGLMGVGGLLGGLVAAGWTRWRSPERAGEADRPAGSDARDAGDPEDTVVV